MKKHREAIVAAARAVFSRKGFHGAGVEEIARKAGVGKGTIYLYFKDKPALFAATVTEGVDAMIEDLRAHLESDRPFPEHFHALIERNVDLYREYGDLAKIVASELTSGVGRKVLAQIETARGRYVDFLARTLEEGARSGYIKPLDFRLTAVALVGMLDALHFDRAPGQEAVSRDKLVAVTETLLSGGILIARSGSSKAS